MTVRTRSASLLLFVAGAGTLASPACRTDDISKAPPGTVFVTVRDSFYQPETVSVMLGRSVRWTNQGTVQHTVVSDSALWQSDLLAPTWWFEVLFDSAGT